MLRRIYPQGRDDKHFNHYNFQWPTLSYKLKPAPSLAKNLLSPSEISIFMIRFLQLLQDRSFKYLRLHFIPKNVNAEDFHFVMNVTSIVENAMQVGKISFLYTPRRKSSWGIAPTPQQVTGQANRLKSMIKRFDDQTLEILWTMVEILIFRKHLLRTLEN